MITGAPQDRGKQRFYSLSVHIKSLITRSKVVTSQKSGPNLPADLRGSPGEIRVAVDLFGRRGRGHNRARHQDPCLGH